MNSCLHHIIDQHVGSQPHAQAVCAWDASFSYQELDRLSTRLAHHLVGLGVGPEVFVPFCFPKSAWTVVTMTAVLKAGGATVALDPSYPRSRVEAILQQVNAKMIVVAPILAALFDGFTQRVVVVDRAFVRSLPLFPHRPCSTVSGCHPAFVVFTSGSTGKPKGITVEHRAICTSSMANGDFMRLGPGSRVLQFAAHTFDVSVQDIFTTLMMGGCVCVPSDEDRVNRLADVINEMDVNLISLTPTVARLLSPAQVPGLRSLVLGGEAVTKDIIATWTGAVRLMVAYGPAECSVCCAAGELTGTTGGESQSFGRALAGAVCWIADPNDAGLLAPVGAIGELLVQGPILARGYLDDPTKTAAAFIVEPPWLKDSGLDPERLRVYKTGDLVRYNSDGTMNFVRRKDNQVKVHGQRTELGEIEHHLRVNLPKGTEAAVEMIRPSNQRSRQMLAAFLSLADGASAAGASEPTTSISDELRVRMMDLKASLQDSMPSYMVPSLYIPLAWMPRTTSGKTDRRSLRLLAEALSEEQLSHYLLADVVRHAPSTRREKVLQTLWSKVLDVSADSIGADANFFRLGGDSVLAMRLVAAARRAGVLLTVANIFRHPTVSDMARVAEMPTDRLDAVTMNPEPELKPFALAGDAGLVRRLLEEIASEWGIDADRIQDVYPCTPLQEGLMTLTMKQPEAYTCQEVYHLPADVDLGRFRAAWETVVRQTAILRTRIVPTTSVKAASYQVVVEENIIWSAADDLQTYLEQDMQEPMRYGERLTRYALIMHVGGGFTFVWTAHHSVYDGWSHPLMVKSVEDVYQGAMLEKSLPFNRFIKHLMDCDAGASAAFWQSHFSGAEPLRFPRLPSPEYQPLADKKLRHTAHIPLQNDTGITTSTIVRAAWALVVAQHSDINVNDVVYGVTQTGRNAPVPGITEMIGPTITTVPLRVSWQGAKRVSDFLQDVQDQATDMIAFENTGLQHIRKLDPACHDACDFNNILIVQPQAETENGPLGQHIVVSTAGECLTYGLVMECTLSDGGNIIIDAGYDSNVVSEKQVERILYQLEYVMQQLRLPSDQDTVDDVEVFTAHDMREISTWNDSSCPEKVNDCIHHVIERQGQAQPNAPAVCSWDASFTYQELEHLAVQLSHHLTLLGVGPEVIVPLCFEKSAWTVVAMLAVLKAGGACVALDPNHPPSRIQKIILDTGAQVILTCQSRFELLAELADHVVVVQRSFFRALPKNIAGPIKDLVEPHNAAFVVFTSGSTGTPKGIILEHSSVCSTSLAHGAALRMTCSSRVIQFAAYTFDVSIEENLITLMYGACVCIPSEHERVNDLTSAMARMGVTWADLTPTVARTLNPIDLPKLDTLVLGGEQLTGDIIRTWADKVHLVNTYGPAECSIMSTTTTFVGRSAEGANIGRGIGCVLWIADASNHDKLVPAGCTGELLIEGPIVARGYLKDPKKTEGVFIEDPPWSRGADHQRRRFYKTGDLVRYNDDGTVSYVGRKDTQVKMHGQRLELGEIEHHLILDCSKDTQLAVDVVKLDCQGGRPALAAFFYFADDFPIDMDSEKPILTMTQPLRAKMIGLEASVSQLLPSYMVPSIYVPLRSMPQTTSNKVDRKALRNLIKELSHEQLAVYSLAAATSERREPSTAKEKQLQGLWVKILNVPANCISADDSFLRLGGDSILAMRLVAAARHASISLSVADIFRHPKLSEMAVATGTALVPEVSEAELKPFALLRGLRSVQEIRGEIAGWKIDPELVQDAYPCTPMQEGLMALTMKEPEAYVLREVFPLPLSINPDHFQAAWEAVFQKTEILRTRIIPLKELGTCQVVLDESILWQTASTLQAYLEQDKQQPMKYGERLSRYAIIEDGVANRYFVWTAHHAVYDGWSHPMILQQVENFCQGNSLDGSSGPSFNRFIEYIVDSNADASAEFWRAQFSGVEPSHFPSLPSPTYQPLADETVQLMLNVVRQVDTGITVSTIVRGAWALITARYSNAEDTIFGATLTGRDVDVTGVEGMVGPTITTVPVRVQLNRDQTIKDYLRAIQDQTTAMIQFQHVGLQHIKQLGEEARCACDFRNLVVVHPSKGLDQQGTLLGQQGSVTAAKGFSTYSIVLQCTPEDGGVRVIAEYDSKVISKNQIQMLLHQFEHVMQQLSLEQDKRLLSDVGVFSSRDKSMILAWNSSYPEVVDECVHWKIEQQALARPDAAAVCSWDRDLTYSELDQLSTRLAHNLVGLGVGPEVMVPFCLEKSSWAIVAIMGIMKAGGGFVPLDPSYPVGRLSEIIDQLRTKVVVASPQTSHLCTGLASKVVELSTSAQDWLLPVNGRFQSQVKPSNAAYAIFTSGSTGKPKGVVIEHIAAASSAAGHGKAMGFNTASRVLQFSSYVFDASIAEILTTLTHGGCVCVAADSKRTGNAIVQVMNDWKVNWAFFTPSFVRLIQPETVPSLKTLVLGGEAMGKDNIDTWAGKVRLMNGYGPTETCVFCVTQTMDPAGSRPQTIGHAISSVSWIVDAHNHDRLAPVGSIGELLVQGPTLARGYLNDAKKTADAFIENPTWLPDEELGRSQRLYKTGDLVRYNADGTLDYIGRKDTQVKINGQRLELGEVETHTQNLCGSKAQVAVDLVKCRNGRKALIAFLHFVDHPSANGDLTIKMSDECRSTVMDLKRSLAERLPSYMVPSVFVPVSHMPTTTSSKIDRKTLRVTAQMLSEEQLAQYSLVNNQKRAPETDMENLLRILWVKILNISSVSTVGADDSFFQLGGDSISAMKLVAATSAATLSLTVAEVFRYPRLCEMARVAKTSSTVTVKPDVDLAPFVLLGDTGSIPGLLSEISREWKIDRRLIKDIYPCTPLQEGLMALTMTEPEAYVIREVFRLPTSVDLRRFQASWETVVQQNPILRTRIVPVGVEGFKFSTCQVVLNENIAWHGAGSLQAYLEQDAQSPVKYGTPLTRYGIIHDGADRHFVWTAHHAAYDGWSYSIILRMVETVYEGHPLSDPPPFNRFIKYLTDCEPETSDSFWRSQLSGAEPVKFPTLPSAGYQPLITDTVGHTMPAKISADITMSTIVRAAWSLVIARYTGINNVVFGVTQTGRNASVKGIMEMVGPTITTFPLRLTWDEHTSISRFLEEVQEQCTNTIPFEHAGLQHIRKLSAECRNASEFNNLLVIQPVAEAYESAIGLRSAAGPAKGVFNFALALECTLGDGQIHVNAGFDRNVISRDQLSRVLHQLEHVIDYLSREQDGNSRTIGDMEALSSEDKRELLEWNSSCPEAVNKCAHEMIEQRALAQLQAPAVCSWDRNFTYEQLNSASTRLAYHLVGVGVGPEVIVPLCFEKSAWTIVAMLAVMKAGGAFVFLDPSYPMIRLQEIMSQVNAKMVLTSPRYLALWESHVTATVVSSDTIDQLPCHAKPPHSTVTPNNMLYVIFTSGSTGKPKGCVVEHTSFLTGAIHQARVSSMRHSSRVLQMAPYSFDVSILEIVTALVAGACICIPSEETRSKGIDNAIREMQVTWAFLTPSVVKLIGPKDVPSLKTLVLGGEPLSKVNVETWAEQLQLANGYGPSECSIAAAANPRLTPTTDPANIGRAIGGSCWIADAADHDRLVPIGAVGELLIEGPIVARGYLGNPEKTAESFIEDPAWMREVSVQRHRRLYKTGDLARYNTDGTIHFMGRKDMQVKVRGQRVELGEIEHHLSTHALIRHAAVLLPSSGPRKGHLVAVMSLREFLMVAGQDDIKPVSGTQRGIAKSRVGELTEFMSQKVPAYMVPTLFMVVEAIPLLPSGKMNRVKLTKWLEVLDKEVYRQLADYAEEKSHEIALTSFEKQMQITWSQVLHISVDEVGVNSSFLSLGGDSISAMEAVSRSRANGVVVTVQEMLRGKTISQLALCTKPAGQPSSFGSEELNVPFDLSPMQKYYANYALRSDPLSRSTNERFNQTFCLRLKQKTSKEVLAHAIKGIVSQHSMLQARFRPSGGDDGSWTQVLTGDISGSFRYRTYELKSLNKAKPYLEHSRTGLNIESGPILAADLVNVPGEGQYLFLVAHHLVIDMVSWGIVLRDLEELLEKGVLSTEKPFSFQTWCRLQAEYSHRNLPPPVVLPFDVPPADFNYWGMATRDNTLKHIVDKRFSLSPEVTTMLLSSCNTALRTEPIDIFLSALLHSFRQTFRDRQVPTVYNLGHGRDTWDPAIDLSRTVGWFTTMCPIHVPVKTEDDMVEVLRLTKDTRRQIPGKGWQYFASRYLNPDGIEVFAEHSAMEVTLNYLGLYRRGMTQNDSVLELARDFDGGLGLGAKGQAVKRFELFSVTGVVEEGRLIFNITYSRQSKHQFRIRRWIRRFDRTLKALAKRLVQMEVAPTPSDFPMLALTNKSLNQLVSQRLPRIVGVSGPDDVEDAYPCSSTQQQLLCSQMQTDAGYYELQAGYEILPPRAGQAVDCQRLLRAWQEVVDRHAALRTVFFESVSEERKNSFDQIVLKHTTARTLFVHVEGDDHDDVLQTLETLGKQRPIDYRDGRPPHQLTICQSSTGKVFCRLDLSHAIIDAPSMALMLRDFSLAYDGRLSEKPRAPLYSVYISYLFREPSNADGDLEFWKTYLNGVSPCYFPASKDGSKVKPPGQLRSVAVELGGMGSVLREFCKRHNVTLANLFHVVWALQLRHYVGTDSVSFGYLVSGRDNPVDRINEIVGLFFNTLTRRALLSESTRITQVLDNFQADSSRSWPHQNCSLVKIRESLNIPAPFFNTLINFSSSVPSDSETNDGIEFCPILMHDPMDVSYCSPILCSCGIDLNHVCSMISSSVYGRQMKV